MRIALVSPYDFPYPGGVTEHIKALDRELRLLGHSVTIIAPSSSNRDSLDGNIVKISGAVLNFPFSGSVARVSFSPNVYQRVKGVLAEGRFDIVHVHEPTVPILPLAMLRHSRAINIATFHAYRDIHRGYEYAGGLYDPFLDRLDGRIAVSTAARDYISRYFPGDYTIIPNGVDLVRFGNPDITPFPQYQDGKLNILFVGRLERRKGFRYLMRAYPYIKAAIPEARLIVVGAYSREDYAPYLRYTRAHRLRDVKFVGYAAAAELPRYYRSAHVFVAPATGYESFGMVLLEAMAAGAPVVASSIPGYRSVISHDVDGLLVTPENEKAIADVVIGLLRDPARQAQLREAGSVTAQRFAWSRVARQVLDYYERQLAAPGATSPVRADTSLKVLASRVAGWFDPR
jgi:phosphatidyl-myo-inositol alpha-mannosyltransferase